MTYALLAVAVVIGVTRIAGVTNDVFKDVAHLYVGGLIFGWAACRHYASATSPYRVWGWTAVALSALEIVCSAPKVIALIRG